MHPLPHPPTTLWQQCSPLSTPLPCAHAESLPQIRPRVPDERRRCQRAAARPAQGVLGVLRAGWASMPQAAVGRATPLSIACLCPAIRLLPYHNTQGIPGVVISDCGSQLQVLSGRRLPP